MNCLSNNYRMKDNVVLTSVCRSFVKNVTPLTVDTVESQTHHTPAGL